jgi:hypothetical protein
MARDHELYGYPLSDKWFFDSGAFSVTTYQAAVLLDHYVQWLLDRKPSIYAALDVLYNGPKSKRNFDLMLDRGLKPIPVFHPQENFDILRHYLKYSTWVGIGGLVSGQYRGKLNLDFLDRCWQIIFETHWPWRIHGFGINQKQLMLRYPWYSVDSTEASSSCRYGTNIRYGPHGQKPTRTTIYQSWTGSLSYCGRFLHSCDELDKLGQFVTKYWEGRGIEWPSQ